MARSPLAPAAVTCAACGAKVREDRARCLRCGQPLVAAADTGRPPSPALARLMVGAGVVLGMALVGAAMRPSPAGLPAAAPAVAQPERPPAMAADTGDPAAHVSPGAVPATSRDALAVGVVAYRSGNVAAAVEQFRRAVDLNPDDAEALNSLGQALVRQSRAAEALQYFDRAIAAAPEGWAYRFNRARALGILERWPAAVAGYRDALRLFPDDYATQFNLAKALQKNGDLDQAVDAFARAIELAPGQADFHLSHGLALEAAGRPAEAAAAYRRYLELADPSAETDKVRGRIARLEKPGAARQVQP